MQTALTNQVDNLPLPPIPESHLCFNHPYKFLSRLLTCPGKVEDRSQSCLCTKENTYTSGKTGHSADSIAEGYRPRSIDALRPYLAQIEAHILEQAGIVFDAQAVPGALRVVAG